MDEEQLIKLVNMIRGSSGCIVDLDSLIGKFESNVQKPSCSRLIFESDSGRLLTAEDVVRQAVPKKSS